MPPKKLTKEERMQARIDAMPEDQKTLLSKTATPEEKKAAHGRLMTKLLNPDPVFDPVTFDPMKHVDNYEIKKRDRVQSPRRLPHFNMHPKKILEGQMIGAYESKQDLYLMIAWLSHRVADLEDAVENLSKKP